MYDEGPLPTIPPPPTAFFYKGEALGHWRYAFPGASATLGQWSGECEVPTAYWIEDGVATIVTGEASLSEAPESVALGWTSSGRALVHTREGTCGGGGEPPGFYLFDGPGEASLLFETPPLSSVDIW